MKKIAIVGTAEPHWRSAPYGDETWEIWTCGGIFATVPRTTRHFEIHDKAETCKGWADSPEQEQTARNVYWDWINQRGPAAVLKKRLPDTPNATEYPLAAVLQAFPDGYFTNTISYMIALALLEGATDIGLWGIDMALTGDPSKPASNEYSLQRPSVEFYLGIAAGKGVNVHLPPETTLLKCRKLYGFDGPEDDEQNRAAQAKVIELKQKLDHVKRVKEQVLRDEAALQMSYEIAGYFARNFSH